VQTILVAAEASWILDQVRTAFVGRDQRVVEVRRGQDVRAAVAEYEPDLTILDMQIANMGGVAVSIDLRLEAGEGRLPDTTILLLLDREADRFLAARADADGELVKPIDAGTLRRAAKQLLEAAEDEEDGEAEVDSVPEDQADAEPEAGDDAESAEAAAPAPG
jgi:DNA-binding response OmpR family regulator